MVQMKFLKFPRGALGGDFFGWGGCLCFFLVLFFSLVFFGGGWVVFFSEGRFFWRLGSGFDGTPFLVF